MPICAEVTITLPIIRLFIMIIYYEKWYEFFYKRTTSKVFGKVKFNLPKS